MRASKASARSQSDVRILLATLEDGFPDLEPWQVEEAVVQAGGEFAAAQELCRRTQAAQASLEQARASAAAQQQQTATQAQQRRWWPKSEFAPALPADAGTGTPGAANRPLLVPHQVFKSLPRSPSTPSAAQPCTQQQDSTQHQGSRPRQPQPARPPKSSALAGSGSSSAGGGAAAAPGILKRAAASGSPDPPPAPAAAAASAPSTAQMAPGGLQPHYAAVFLSERSRAALLQHAPPLHEAVSADHMTLAHRPSPEVCAALPLGRAAPLFVEGAAADYRAQAVAVQPPSWLPFLSESVPHVTVSVGEGVPAREAGDLVAAARARPGGLAPVARLKLLQGTVGVQLSDGSRVFSAEELQAKLAAAAGARRSPAAAAAPPGGAPRLLKRGEAPPAAAAAEPATEAAVAGGGAAPAPAEAAATVPGGLKAGVTWDLDSLMDELHLADQPERPPASSGGSSAAAAAATAAAAAGGSAGGGGGQAQAPRRGILKLPAAVATQALAAAGREEDGGPASSRARPPARPLAVRRPPQAQHPSLPHRPAQPQHEQQQQWRQQQQQQSDDGSGDAAVPQAPLVLGKSVAEEAAEAAAGDAPLDLAASLAAMFPQDRPFHQHDGTGRAASPPPAMPSPSAGGSGGAGPQQGEGPGGGASWSPAAAPDPESLRLLRLQFPAVHGVVADAALRMHGGSLQDAAHLLTVLAQQGPPPAAPGGGAVPQAPTLGDFFPGLLPDAPGAATADTGFWDDCVGGGGSGYQPSSAPPSGGKRVQFAARGQAPAAGGRGGGRGGRGAGRRGGPIAGEDPMSVAERQAMNLHLSAKRLYAQAAQEALDKGQAALARELQATARSHADAAAAARRRANASAYRSTNSSLLNTFTLDLHGQHVDEALASLERYLVTLGGLGHPGGVMLQVITGVGRHSVGNQPRVLPAVVRYLSDARYQFDSEEDNPGVINVMIGC